jgi:hypothetical protein
MHEIIDSNEGDGKQNPSPFGEGSNQGLVIQTQRRLLEFLQKRPTRHGYDDVIIRTRRLILDSMIQFGPCDKASNGGV